MNSSQRTGRILVIVILQIVFVPLGILSVKEPVKVGLPTLVFVLTGVWVLLSNARKAR